MRTESTNQPASVNGNAFAAMRNNPVCPLCKKPGGEYLLYIGVLIALLPVLFLRDFTPSNELRYLSIADEALRNHTFFAFTDHGEPYADKPPLYLWLVMLCRALTGAHRMWLLSLFSLLPAWGIVRVMDRWSAGELTEETRPLARLMLLTSVLFLGSAATLRMDMLMSLFIVLALRVFWRLYRGSNHFARDRWLFPLWIFLGLFTKGPLGLLIPLCCTAVFLAVSGQLRTFFRYWGWRTWCLLVVCCAVWFACVYAEGGRGYLYNLAVHQTVGRAVNSFHHDAPFYYYAVSIWYSILPWSLLSVGIIVAALRRKFACSDLQRFYLTVCVTTFLLLSIISAKLQIYLLPAIPFFIYTAAMLLPRFHDNLWIRLSLMVPAVVFALALPALLVLRRQEEPAYLHHCMVYVAAGIFTLQGLGTLCLLYARRRHVPVVKAARFLGVCLLLAVFAGGWAVPAVNPDTGYGTLCKKALELSDKYGIDDIRAWHISRPQPMDVYLGKPFTVLEDEAAPEAESGAPYLLLTRKRYLPGISSPQVTVVGRFAVVVVRPEENPPAAASANLNK